MRYRFREQYEAMSRKRQSLRRGEFSEPDEPGAKVRILVPFMAELAINKVLDGRKSFELQTERAVEYFEKRGRVAEVIMNARTDDFRRVLADKTVPNVVWGGFGNLSAIAVQLSKPDEQPFRYGYLDWLHLAGMTTHLKLGKCIMLQCCVPRRPFSAPLAVPFVNSHRDIFAVMGRARYAAEPWENEIRPVTVLDELTYEKNRELYPMQKALPLLPDVAYDVLRDARGQFKRDDFPEPEKILYPEEMKQFLR